ncbi:ATP-dependent DNA helicase DDX31 [Hydra vulgaris]|nr:probable ATP-dependent RNA helicase ddx31 [Hydra vulgaris]
MENESDSLLLNLEPYTPKEKSAYVKKKSIQKEKGYEQKKSFVKSTHSNLIKSKSQSYVDPAHFTTISSLFNKNPDIPQVISNNNVSNVEEVVFSSENVSDLPISDRLRNNLRDQFKFKSLTQIQMISIPPLLNGKDAMIKSPTGSGKTFCYAIPIIDKIIKMKPSIGRQDGPFALIIVPTRELALQTFNIVQDLCKSCISIVPGMLIGGEKCKSEKARLRKGINIIVATPGRFQYHLKETSCLNVSKIKYLVLDEADKLLSMGFEKTIKEILGFLDQHSSLKRQSVLLSATLSKDIENLASLSLSNHVFVDSSKKDDFDPKAIHEYVVPSSLTQYFVTVPAKLRLVTIFCFICDNAFVEKKKIIVFVSNKNSVHFHYEALKLFLAEVDTHSEMLFKNVYMLHGDMTQEQRFKNFDLFKESSFGVLFCTDVGARGLDIKKVDWIVQYSCPTQFEDYLHRVGRTARIGEKGKSLLFLLPSEVGYVKFLNDSLVILNEVDLFNVLKDFIIKKYSCKTQNKIEEKVTYLQNIIELECTKSKNFKQLAISAYNSFIQSYSSYPSTVKEMFHVKNLHLGHIAKSFGLRDAPNKLVNQVAMQPAGIKRKQKNDEENKLLKESKKQKMLKLKDEVISGPRTKKENSALKKKNSSKKKNIRI